MKKVSIVLVIFSAIICLFFWWIAQKKSLVILNEKNIVSENHPYQTEPGAREISEVATSHEQPIVSTQGVPQNVPFVSQAPTGNWKDPVFQNACEEAALLMAEKWTIGRGFGTAKESEDEIRRITVAEEKYFPASTYDLSLSDTFAFSRKYFPEMDISLKRGATEKSLRESLAEGSIIIVSVNGQKLHNPNFTLPGPLYHTLLIRGYDPVTDEFVTNDPGTRRGNGYRYSTDILFAAMQDYETGYHGKLFPDEKVMLIVEKEKEKRPVREDGL